MNKTPQHSDPHSNWHDRMQDAIDDATGPLEAMSLSDELRAHVDGCEPCRSELAKLSAMHERLSREFSTAPELSEGFSARVFARIDSQEEERLAAKLHAEREFRRRADAFDLDWRGFFQRHLGSIVATLTVFGAVIAAMSSRLSGVKGWFGTALGNAPWISGFIALPLAIAAISASAAGITIWWLQSRTR